MSEHYPFINTPLPYAYDALEPFIDEKTMRLHHDRHLQTYVDNLNEALSGYPRFQGWTLEELLVNTASLPEEIRRKVRDNGGGVFNHRFYFSNLTNPAPSGPRGVLEKSMNRELGGPEPFKEKMKEAALSVFGSGYAWLVVDAAGQLQIVTTANQDTPLPLGFCPVLNVDVWEHAYYLKHYNMRADYFEDWFRVVDWDNVNRNYLRCFGREA